MHQHNSRFLCVAKRYMQNKIKEEKQTKKLHIHHDDISIYIFYVIFKFVCSFMPTAIENLIEVNEKNKTYFKKQHANFNAIEVNETQFEFVCFLCVSKHFCTWYVVRLQTFVYCVECARCANFCVFNQ